MHIINCANKGAEAIAFRQWTNKSYAVFKSLGRQIHIGVLAIDMSERLGSKDQVPCQGACKRRLRSLAGYSAVDPLNGLLICAEDALTGLLSLFSVVVHLIAFTAQGDLLQSDSHRDCAAIFVSCAHYPALPFTPCSDSTLLPYRYSLLVGKSYFLARYAAHAASCGLKSKNQFGYA